MIVDIFDVKNMENILFAKAVEENEKKETNGLFFYEKGFSPSDTE